MNELIKVDYSTDRPTISARELHEFLEVKTAYKDWFPRMCEYGFAEGQDFCSFLSESKLAKLLKHNGVKDMGQNRLFDWMRNNGYLIRRKGTDYNMPTQRSMELGLMEIKETSISHADGHVSVSKTPKITGKGQQYFISKLLDTVCGKEA